MNATKLAALILVFLFGSVVARAQLVVTVSAPKATANKSLIKLALKNSFKEKVESARATIFLIDDQGKVVGQGTQWVIGGTKDKPALAPDTSMTFNFVIATDKPFTKTKVTVGRLILEGGKVVDPVKNVVVQE
jgi:hypothetical protein